MSLGNLDPEEKDEDGNLLWDDIVPFCYLSPAYSFNDLEILRCYGLEVVYMEDLVARAEADLELPRSRMRTSKMRIGFPASTDHVRNAIFERYRSSASTANVSLQTSRKHLEYLYLTQKHESVVVPLAFSRIYVCSEGEEALFPRKVDVYKADNSDYGVKKLLKATPPGPKPGDGTPGLSVPTLHRIYQEDIPESPPGHPLTWNGFLNKYLDI
ncbi:uncharacterized protein Z519_08733 [Cladophialophora bantiana CBS 173.52]|uniref:Uncharacterized protein n=1 Tax=Cladophialophora bantiana (strain ATCC 10958 / CBS 173.52 / CDC B-1940 / NIH 8579) TaxID=1442370 RepID=A0A0D2HJM9_CLAB1|nr:uncharacterized protein Z519_08733 [Cladophialophora bantiana CBS 173.52]KIW90950.1 hypothetical protein Z519_08733 [Cladophialophora bantiana CBS 173.52]